VGKRKRQPKPGGDEKRRQTRWKSIEEKCNPAMFEMAQLWKESIEALRNAGPNPSKEAVEAIDARVSERSVELHHRYPDLALLNSRAFIDQSIFSESAFTADSDSRGVLEWLHFERHGIPFKHDEEDAMKGDWGASRRVQKTIADAEQLRCGKGPIKRFQGNLEHSNMFETMWGLGIERLTEEELAAFFDKYCPCGIESHNPDALGNHRERFQGMLRRSDGEQG
jgi:hypothetical protein